MLVFLHVMLMCFIRDNVFRMKCFEFPRLVLTLIWISLKRLRLYVYHKYNTIIYNYTEMQRNLKEDTLSWCLSLALMYYWYSNIISPS